MIGMLKWRFGKLTQRFEFHAAVISHPDQDHYLGFRPIFQHQMCSSTACTTTGSPNDQVTMRLVPTMQLTSPTS